MRLEEKHVLVKVESSVWNMLSLRFLLEKHSWQLAGGDGKQVQGVDSNLGTIRIRNGI